MSAQKLLEMKTICKSFPGVQAVDGVSFDLEPGEVHLLMGENGAGKSTLLKILSGAYLKDSGDIVMRGKNVKIRGPKDSIDLGISIIYQELNLIPEMTVMQNIFLGDEQVSRAGIIKLKKSNEIAQQLLDTLGIGVDVNQPVKTLGVGEQQLIEIAKAVHRKSDIIIMDEPTSALSDNEIELLFKVIRNLTSQGVGIIYVSHRLEEAKRIGDRATVLRNGKLVCTVRVKEIELDDLIAAMLGEGIKAINARQETVSKQVLLDVRNISRKRVLRNIDLQVREGEILGISGLMGSGRTELLRAIFGADSLDKGDIYISGKKVKMKNPFDAMEHGIAYLPENRKEHGLIVEQSVLFNITVTCLKKITQFMFVDVRKQEQICDNYKNKLNIKVSNILRPVKYLSGGNQQKVVLAKWLATNPKIFLVDEPTRGMDVGAKRDVLNIIQMLADQGVAVIIVDSEIPELVEIADRILVLRKGMIVGELCGEEISHKNILKLATVG